MPLIFRPPSDEWVVRGVHWHGYVHLPSAPLPTSRPERLSMAPHSVLTTPEDVADWLMDRGRSHLRRQRVCLFAEAIQAATNDEAVHSAGWEHDHFAASEARCVYVGHGDTLLYAEVVSHDMCAVAEHQAAA